MKRFILSALAAFTVLGTATINPANACACGPDMLPKASATTVDTRDNNALELANHAHAYLEDGDFRSAAIVMKAAYMEANDKDIEQLLLNQSINLALVVEAIDENDYAKGAYFLKRYWYTYNAIEGGQTTIKGQVI